MNFEEKHIEKVDVDELLADLLANKLSLVIYNDDHNTFDWVIKCLVELCKHSTTQAEQCAWIIHHKGKYIVKSGLKSKLKPLCVALCDRGLSAVIE